MDRLAQLVLGWIILVAVAKEASSYYAEDGRPKLGDRCPDDCKCTKKRVRCSDLEEIPECVRKDVEILIIEDSPDLKTIQNDAFEEYSDTLQELRLRRTGLETLKSFAFSPLTDLKVLEISESEYFYEIHQEAFAGLKLLHTLDLSYSALCRIQTFLFTDTPNLENIDISYGNIQKIDENAFDGLDSLLYLNISGNRYLDEIKRDTFSHSPILQKMRMNDCGLRVIYPEFVQEPFESGTLIEFQAYQNNWQCDSDMCEFTKWENANPSFADIADLGRCADPSYHKDEAVLSLDEGDVCYDPKAAAITFVGIICFTVLVLGCFFVLAAKNCFAGMCSSNESQETQQRRNNASNRAQNRSRGAYNAGMELEEDYEEVSSVSGAMAGWKITDIDPPSYEMILASNTGGNEESVIQLSDDDDSMAGEPPPDYNENSHGEISGVHSGDTSFAQTEY